MVAKQSYSDVRQHVGRSIQDVSDQTTEGDGYLSEASPEALSEMNDSLHRILSGSPARRIELIAAGIFVAVWFLMDVVQFTDWAIQKFSPTPVICSTPTPL